MILILGEPADPHIGAVCAHLSDRGAQYEVLDPYSTVLLPAVSTTSSAAHRFTAIWDRLKPVAVPRSDQAQYVIRERLSLVRSLQLLHGSARLMNPPLSTEMARSKALQLAVAMRAGFVTPRTYVGNNPVEVRRFVETCATGAVAKSATWYFDSKGEFSFTKLVTPRMLDSGPSIAYSPLIYQEYIPKEYELRVTCVGRRMFAVKIESQDNTRAIVDWRRDQFSLVYKKVTLPSELKAKLRRVQKGLRLIYGAFDLIRTPRGQHVFLEVNATGNWLWLENRVGLPIAKEVARWLGG
jgi:glutathione synthase/RimK-type ligase-like ATP-grasp enzyme